LAYVVLCALLVATLVAQLGSLSGFTIPFSPSVLAPVPSDLPKPDFTAPDFTKYAACRRQYVTNVYNCVDFTNDFAREAAGNGLSTWGVTMGFYRSTEVPAEWQAGHAMIITADCTGQYWVVEPQSGSIYGSWQQPGGGDPQIPHVVQGDMFQRFGEPFKTGYTQLPRVHHNSRNIYVTVFPKGMPVSKDGVAPSGSMTFYP
jgi:hypothetical protein